MKLADDFIQTQKLTPEQVTAIEETSNNSEAEIKKTYDGKANTDAEKILDGAAAKVAEMTGIKREQGQKIADYITFAGQKHVEGKLASERTSLDKKQKDLDEQIKNGAGDPALKAKLEDLQGKYDTLQKKEAELDELKAGNYKELYTNLLTENETIKINMAFEKVKPVFPDTVNKYEADAKWNSFVASVKQTHTIEFDETNTPVGIDKNNKHKVVKITDLLAKNEEITGLLAGRSLKGPAIDGKPPVKIKDVPFDVPANATPADRQKAIKEYLVNELKLSNISKEYSDKFAEYNTKILQGTA